MPPAPDLTRQAARYGGLVEAAHRYLALLWPRVDWGHPKAQDAVTAMYQSIVQRFGAGAAAVAADLYDEMRAEQKPRNAYRAIAADPVPNDQVAKIVASAFLGHDNPDVSASAQTTSDLPVADRVQTRLESTLSKLVQQPARDTIEQNANKDPAKPRWIRVPTGPTTCEFCIMNASREHGYNSQKSATTIVGRRGEPRGVGKLGSSYHRKCNCVAVPVFPGQDPYQVSPNMSEYRGLYDEAVDRAGTSSDVHAVMAEMRKVLKERTSPEPKPPALPEPPGLPELIDLDTPKPAAHKPDTSEPDEPLPGVRRRAVEFDPLGPDLALINPNHAAGRQWQVNCTRCSTAVELQARGYDVTAEPRPDSVRDNGYANVLNKWTSPDGTPAGKDGGYTAVRAAVPDGEVLGMSTGSRVWDFLPAKGRGKVNAAKTAADTAVTAWGDGARGYITVEWSKANGGGAHIFNVVNRGGRAVYFDGQTNETDASGHWDRIKSTAGSCRIVRTDDLAPTSDVIDWVRSRNDNDDLLAERKARMLARVAANDPKLAPAGAAGGDLGGGPDPRWLKQSRTYAKRLDGRYRQAVIAYTGNDHKQINGWLRSKAKAAGEPNSNPAVDAQIKAIDAVLAENPLRQETVLTRTTDMRTTFQIAKGEDLAKIAGKFRIERGFMSTTRFPDGGRTADYKVPVRITVTAPAGTPAAAIEDISQFNGQGEVLLGRDLWYVLDNPRYDDAIGMWRVNMTISGKG